ncbi:glycoside hydrolase family 5 protein [Roseateles caseinilyticus]|nr:glycoside hydrolase family 5 protein [Pelomonas sp. P7]
MRLLLSTLLLALGASAGTAAQAQSCGSGGGATVCLVANGAADQVQLNWTASGAINGLEVYRNTSATPTGRSRIASLSAKATSYADATAATGTPYWYWVKFSTAAGSYNSSAATASRGSSCAPTAVTPYINVSGTWTQTASASVPAGESAVLGPQPATGGMWTWNGCGTAGGAREQTIRPTAACTATATYTNACGAKSLQSFAIGIAGPMRNITSLQMSKEMVPGWNVGNTLDATPTETSWGNPLINQALMTGIKNAGFKSIRLPVTWTTHVDANDNIDPVWMARVTQVVKYARNAGLYVVLNLHHEGGWLDNVLYANQAANNARLAKLWTQIATNFRDFDDYLLFAGLNEVGKENAPWGVPPQKEWLDVQNGYHQVFVNAVRATGGNNAKRHLVVQGYFTNIDTAYDYAVLPTDTVANRLFFEVHYYDPYNFTINGDGTMWQWGATATNPTETWADEPYVDAQFQKMKTRFIDKGVPVILGEYGAYLKPAYPGMAPYRKAWAEYVTHSSVQHGLVPMWWDTGEMIDRTTGAVKLPDMINSLVNSAK